MPTYPFLSPEWLDEARNIREEYKGKAGAAAPPLKMNQVITDVPFGEGRLDAHIDTTSGEMQMDVGHLDDAEVKITIPYSVAKALFVDANAQAAMQAFMSGQIKVEGDMTKLMSMQQAGAATDPVAIEIAQRLKAITAD
ncbi:MAG TPA: SCP2 sterol-binding domain-containing protein [Acidimicrobiales bacterium]|jgi:hypothetical protein|nr:SCP2 sterol-binding domain-containing protein [Acidimicrobiales bacterium]